MRFPFSTGVVLGAALTWGAWVGFFADPAAAPIEPGQAPGIGASDVPDTPAPPPPREGFVGSAACAECHPNLHARWAKSPHALSIQEFSEDAVKKPFEGEIFASRGIDHRIGPGPEMTTEGPGGERATYPVERVIGVRRVQMFTTSLDRGRIQVLPVFLEVPPKKWFDFSDFIFGKPRDFVLGPADQWYSFARNFNSRCIVCHAVDPDPGYDPDTGAYETTWKELTVGCESCHGPAAAHVEHHRGKRDGHDPITNPARLDARRSDMVCGQCHAEGEMVVPGYRPGDDLFRYLDPAGLEDSKHLHPDGRARELIHDLLPTWSSSCGPMTCTTCHDPHGHANPDAAPGLLRFDVDDDRMCTQCHADTEPHSHHEPESAGSRCVRCHMPRLVIEGGHGRVYDHTISIPSMTNTIRHGTPNACQLCHLLEETGFEREPFARWYPDAEKNNRRVALADAIAGGRAGDPDAKDKLLAIARDGNEVDRAGAVRLLGPYGVDTRAFLQDESPLVRRAAVAGVDEATLVELLSSDHPVLRYRAALRLAERRPADPAAVIAALEPFAEERPDQVVLHMALARLHEMAGDRNAAVLWYVRYLRINDWDTGIQAHVERLKKGLNK